MCVCWLQLCIACTRVAKCRVLTQSGKTCGKSRYVMIRYDTYYDRKISYFKWHKVTARRWTKLTLYQLPKDSEVSKLSNILQMCESCITFKSYKCLQSILYCKKVKLKKEQSRRSQLSIQFVFTALRVKMSYVGKITILEPKVFYNTNFLNLKIWKNLKHFESLRSC